MSRIKGSKNLKPSKAELYKEIENRNIEPSEQKALAPSFGRLDTLVIAPKTIANNPIELIKLNKGFVGICNAKNATSIASTPIRLYATSNSKNEKFLYPTKSLNSKEIDAIKTNSHSLVVKNAANITEIVEHPIFSCLNNFNNGDLNYYDGLELTSSYLGMIGNAFWKINKNKGVPVGIEVLPAEYTTVKLSDQMKVTGYRTFNGIYEQNYSEQDIIHFKNVSPGLFWRIWNQALVTGLYGMGDAEYVLDEIYLYNSINDFLRALTENNAIPSAIIKYTGGRLDKNTMQDVQSQWDKMMRTWKRAGKTKVMDQDFDFQAISIPPKDLDFAEGRRWLLNTIACAFGVPIDLLTTDNSNRATANTAIQTYFRFTIKPKLKRIEERLNSHLVPLFDDRLFIQFDECVPTDQSLYLKKEEQDLINGVITINEVRLSRGLSPVAWGDEPYAPKKETIKDTFSSDENKKEDRASMNEDERNARGNDNAEKESAI